MAPPEWADREILWNAVEENEETKDSRLAREFVISLPIELDRDEQISLISDFIQTQFVAEGMCADVAIHDVDGHNPHAHFMLIVRPLSADGTWQHKTEKEYLCVKDGEERGFTASEYKEAQRDGWEKQSRIAETVSKIYGDRFDPALLSDAEKQTDYDLIMDRRATEHRRKLHEQRGTVFPERRKGHGER